MVSPTKYVMLLAFFLGLVLNVAGLSRYGEVCQCPDEVDECDGECTGYGIVCTYRLNERGVWSDKQYCVEG